MSETPNTSSNPVSLNEGDALDPSSRSICPTCGHQLSNRARHQSGRDTGGHPPKSGVGEGDGDRFTKDVTWFHYIPVTEKNEWAALGWQILELGGYQGGYSVLGKWTGRGSPVMP